jgi:hypothetical protein
MDRIAASGQNRGWLKLVVIGILVELYVELYTGGEPSYAQTASTFNQDFRLWSPVYLTVALPSSFLAYMEVSPRFSNDVSDLDQIVLRPALGYELTENLSIWQGYAWVSNYQPSHVEENLVYQQLMYGREVANFAILSRTRLEERWIEHVDGTAVRFRHMLRGMYPLPSAPAWALVVYDEIFVNLNTVGTRGPAAGFDQNRFFLGINRTFSTQFDVDVGYQNQLLNSRSIPELSNQMNHTILIQFFINL